MHPLAHTLWRQVLLVIRELGLIAMREPKELLNCRIKYSHK
jgi:hypothetical protein